MNDITRRDFLNGVALVITAGFEPPGRANAAAPATYPPAPTGMRGAVK
jgi:hypothetical protein